MISVIIVSYNVPGLLIRCIDSIEASVTTCDVEVIIVDNNSSDSCRESILGRFGDVTWIQNSKNVGFASAVNIGLCAAKGGIYLLINPDSEIASDAIEAIHQFWIGHSDAGIVGGKIISFDGAFQKQCRRHFPKPSSAFFKLFRFTNIFPDHHLTASYELNLAGIDQFHEVDAVSGAFMSFSRELVQEIGMFDEGYFLMGEDLDFCYRSSHAHKKNYYLPQAVMTHHHGASRHTRPYRSIYYGHLAMSRYYRKFLHQDYPLPLNWLVYLGIFFHFVYRSLASCICSFARRHHRETA